jgi:hypothetical protein
MTSGSDGEGEAPGSSGAGRRASPAAPAEAAALVRGALARGRAALSEWESKSPLRAHGVPVPAGAAMRALDQMAWYRSYMAGRQTTDR